MKVYIMESTNSYVSGIIPAENGKGVYVPVEFGVKFGQVFLGKRFDEWKRLPVGEHDLVLEME